ncbi:Cell differentiation protein RCD1 [Datura stramonium]|uniref:Cell differentiation protein RCD1 n=1 Tax=Datura stramonium TaxID=4076 RepID=A0ABS8VK66_DATST|nr:Cell differentiation protein RCD1 [Datura stramonium]
MENLLESLFSESMLTSPPTLCNVSSSPSSLVVAQQNPLNLGKEGVLLGTNPLAVSILISLTPFFHHFMFDDPYGPMVLHFFMKTEVVPLCLACMDLCDELSRKAATLIVMKILMQAEGLAYCCATAERFYSIVQDDHETSWMLQVLYFNIYEPLNFLHYEDSYDIAKLDTTVRKA